MNKNEKLVTQFGKTLIQLRKKIGISQEGLAYESGLARSFVSEIERGIKQPSLSTIFIIADTLEIKASILIKSVEEAIK